MNVMKKSIFAAVALCVPLVAMSYSCSPHAEKTTDGRGIELNVFGNDDSSDSRVVTDKRKLGYYSQVSCSLPCDMEFVQGSGSSIEITGGKDFVDNVDVIHDGETLRLRWKDGWRKKSMRNVDLKIRLVSPDLVKLSLSGAVDFESKGLLDTDNLHVGLSGACEVKFGNVVCDSFTMGLSGAGELKADDIKAQKVDVKISGAGESDLHLTDVRDTRVSVSGAGDIDVTFVNCDNADCHISGAGSITLAGALKSLSKSVSGAGSIDTKKLHVQ